MALLVRRLNISKWTEDIDLTADRDVCADALTNGLKTESNRISVWEIEDKKDLNRAILALVTGPKQTRISTTHVVFLDREDVTAADLQVDETVEGDTCVDSLKGTHRDIAGLTYSTLGRLKDCVIDGILAENTATIIRTELKDIIADAIDAGDLTVSSLHVDLQRDLAKLLPGKVAAPPKETCQHCGVEL